MHAKLIYEEHTHKKYTYYNFFFKSESNIYIQFHKQLDRKLTNVKVIKRRGSMSNIRSVDEINELQGVVISLPD